MESSVFGPPGGTGQQVPGCGLTLAQAEDGGGRAGHLHHVANCRSFFPGSGLPTAHRSWPEALGQAHHWSIQPRAECGGWMLSLHGLVGH